MRKDATPEYGCNPATLAHQIEWDDVADTTYLTKSTGTNGKDGNKTTIPFVQYLKMARWL